MNIPIARNQFRNILRRAAKFQKIGLGTLNNLWLEKHNTTKI